MRLLVEAGADVNGIEQPPEQPKPGWTYSYDSPLIRAAESGCVEAVRLLLDAGADINYCSRSGGALGHAIRSANEKKYLGVIRLLLDRGCAPDIEPTGHSLLLTAAWNRNCRGIISELVKRGADPNAIDKQWGCVPLHRAVEEDNKFAVQELLEADANPLIAAPTSDRGDNKWSGLTPLDFAKSLKKKMIVEMLEAAVAEGGQAPAQGGTARATKAKPARVPSAAASWDRLEGCLQKSHPKVFATLATPATDHQVNQLIGAVKIRLTKEVQEFFQRHNGQSGGPELIELDGEQYGFRLLSVEQAAQEWSIWKELNDGGDFEDAEATAGNGVREVWWHDKWLPMAGNGAGDFLCFDISPGKGGSQGQIITLWHERPNREVVFESAQHLLAELAGAWEAKEK